MNKTENSTVITKVICAIIFMMFTFAYLYNYQAGVMAMAQHVLSKGITVYNPFISAVWITAVLMLLQVGIYLVTRLEKRAHALTYFPSLLILTIISDVSETIDQGFSFGVWLWVTPLILIAYGGLVWFCKQVQPFEPPTLQHAKIFTKIMWINLFQMGFMMLLTGLFSNHSEVFHYRMHMEQLMLDGKYADALEVGKNSLVTDSSLTCLRITCLTKTHQLGDKLFTYPLEGGSAAMKENGTSVKVMMWKDPHTTIYLRKGKRVYPRDVEHILTGYLLDRNLDGFVNTLLKYRHGNLNKLPRHYREALVLYTHRRAHPKVVYHHAVMDTDFQDFQNMERKYTHAVERDNALHNTFGNTYWYYFCKK